MNQKKKREKIAIIGIGCVYPGAENKDQFWQNLILGRDTTSDATGQDLGADPALFVKEEKGQTDSLCYLRNGYIRNFKFNPDAFGLTFDRANELDNLLQWSLHASAQALTDSSYFRKAHLKRCGVIFGSLRFPTQTSKYHFSEMHLRDIEPYCREILGNGGFEFENKTKTDLFQNTYVASGPSVIVTEVLGLKGPAFTIDAACASTFYCLELANYYLQTNQADLMIAGAVSAADRILLNYGFNGLQAFPSAHEESICLDKNSKGMKVGEGAGAFVLKRLSDAVQDRDKIYCVIESMGLSNEGKGKHILSPSSKGQLASMHQCYQYMDSKIDYLECHATGTNIGDKTELNTLEMFYKKQGNVPFIGANKTNFGHLLTASGTVSLLKVILSMQYGVIPATIKVKNPLESDNKVVSGDKIIRKTTPWPSSKNLKRAGINSFGFGGSNSHLLLSEWTYNKNKVNTSFFKTGPSVEQDELVIVGMASKYGNLDSIDDLKETVKELKQDVRPFIELKWGGIEKRPEATNFFGKSLPAELSGAFIESFDLDCRELKLQPKAITDCVYENVLMLKVAHKALCDAGLNISDGERNIAVIIGAEVNYYIYKHITRFEIPDYIRRALKKAGIEIDEERLLKLDAILKDTISDVGTVEEAANMIGNIIACRISSLWDFTGPSFSLSSQENSTFKAIQLAEFLLTYSNIEAVLIGAIDLSGNLEPAALHNFVSDVAKQKPGFGFSSEIDGWCIGEGAGALVLRRKKDALGDKNRIYSAVKSLKINQYANRANLKDQVKAGLQNALTKADLKNSDISYIEAYASGIKQENEAELYGLKEVYESKDHKVVLGSVKSNIGHAYVGAGIAGIINASLCVYYKYLPGTPGPQESISDSLIVLDKSQHWKTTDEKRRLAAVNCIGSDYSFAHMIIEESDQKQAGTQKISSINSKPGFIVTVGCDLKPTNERIFSHSLISGLLDEDNGTIAGDKFKKPETPKEGATGGSKQIFFQTDKADVKKISEKIGRNRRIINSELNRKRDIQYPRPSKIRGILIDNYKQNQQNHSKYLDLAIANNKHLLHMLDNITESRTICVNENFSRKSKTQTINRSHTARSAPVKAPVFKKQKPVNTKIKTGKCIWNRDEIVEMVEGRLSNILGNDYAEADTYPIRIRPPAPPFLFCSRVTKLTAKPGKLEPFEMDWDFDIPENYWCNFNDQVAASVFTESSHSLLLGLAYIGCDKMFKGQLRYRVLDVKLSIFEINYPNPGDTFEGKAKVTNFLKTGQNYLIFFHYEANFKGKIFLRMDASAGLFTSKDLQSTYSLPSFVNTTKKPSVKKPFKPFLKSKYTSFSNKQIMALHKGDFAACFGAGYDTFRPHAFTSDDLLMIDRVISVDSKGGIWGLGDLVCEKHIDPDYFIFDAHFINDPVLPGAILMEGCNQAVIFYMYYIGLHSLFDDFRISVPDKDLIDIKFRGEVEREAEKIELHVIIKDIELDPYPFVNAVAEFTYKGRIIGNCENVGFKFIPRHTSVKTKKTQKIQLNDRVQIETEKKGLRSIIQNFDEPCYIHQTENGSIATIKKNNENHSSYIPPIQPEDFGSAQFKIDHNTKYAYIGGAMAQAISSKEMVIALGRAGMMGSFGAAGLSLNEIEHAIIDIQKALPKGPYAFNLIHNMYDPPMEKATVALFLKYNVQSVEASAFLTITPSLVYYRVAGLSKNHKGRIIRKNKIIAKISRSEVARQFMLPAPDKMVKQLVEQGLITSDQAEFAKTVPMADDITAEADSGGHTDNKPFICLLPTIKALKDSIQNEYKFDSQIRVGTGGGISTLESVHAAFSMGADYIVTGSINQGCRESGTSEYVKQLLARCGMGDITMAPAADSFEMGVKVQVLKKETLFPMRAQRLYEIYKAYDSIEEIPGRELKRLETQVFQKPLSQVWQESYDFFIKRDPGMIEKAACDPKKKMALIFRWYLGLSSKWAVSGVPDKKTDYQIWCGPSLGAFNEWAKGSYLEDYKKRKVADIAMILMEGAAMLQRKLTLKSYGIDVNVEPGRIVLSKHAERS